MPNSGRAELFVRELHNLVDALGIADRHHILGQSWGGFLGPGVRTHAAARAASRWCSLTRPRRSPTSLRRRTGCAALLPPEVEATLRRHEEAGTTDDPEYAAACEVFYRRHLCRLDPWPEEIVEAFAWIERDPTVYHTMNGPSEFHVIGSIRDWQSKGRLGEIDVPTLLVSGRHDEATPALQETLRDGIRGSEWVCFEESSHMPHVEERERYMQVVGDWLARND